MAKAKIVDAVLNPDFPGNEAFIDMSINVNDKAPEFTLQDENGKEISLKSLRGKVVVLYFYPRLRVSRHLQTDAENRRRVTWHLAGHAPGAEEISG
jgi:hypothetical protein